MSTSPVLEALLWRPLRRSPWRFLFTLLGVAAGVAAVVSTLAASRAALASLVSGVTEVSGATVWEVSAPSGLTIEEASRWSSVAADAVIAPLVEETALVEGWNDAVRVLGVDPLVDRHVRTAATGADARQESWTGFTALLTGQGVFVPQSLATELGLVTGANLPLVVRSRRISTKVLGVFPVPRGTTALDRVVVADIALVQEWRQDNRIDRLEFVPRGSTDPQALRDRLQALAPDGATIRHPDERAARTSGLVKSLEFNLTSLSGISLLVGAVLVATTLATSVVQRKKTIAILVSLGASRAQLARSLLSEALVLGLLGGALGALGGAWLARGLLPAMRQTYATVVPGAPGTAIDIAWTDVVAGVALGVGCAMCAALLPLLETLRVPPVQSLRAEAPSFLSSRGLRIAIGLAIGFWLAAVELLRLPAWNGLPVWALLATLCVLGVMFAVHGPLVDALGRVGPKLPRILPLRLASAALSAGRRRAAWAAGAVGVAVSLSISIAVMVGSFRQSVIAWTDDSLKADLSVRPVLSATGVPVGTLDMEVQRIAENICGTQAVAPYHVAEARLGNYAVTLAGADFALGSQRGPVQFVKDDRDPKQVLQQAHVQREVLINEALHTKTGLRTGDTLHFQARGVDYERRIAGIARDYGDSRGTVTLDLVDFLAIYPRSQPLQLALFLPSREATTQAHDALVARLADSHRVDVLYTRELRAQVLEVFERTFAITGALQGASAIVALVAVLVVLYALVSERRKDLALLSALGASRAQILGTVCAQAGVLGLLGAVAGAVAGLVIGIVLVDVVNVQSFGWTLELVQPWSQVASTMGWVVLACLLAALPPARNATSGSERSALDADS